jgi:hypothetical protein
VELFGLLHLGLHSLSFSTFVRAARFSLSFTALAAFAPFFSSAFAAFFAAFFASLAAFFAAFAAFFAALAAASFARLLGCLLRCPLRLELPLFLQRVGSIKHVSFIPGSEGGCFEVCDVPGSGSPLFLRSTFATPTPTTTTATPYQTRQQQWPTWSGLQRQ